MFLRVARYILPTAFEDGDHERKLFRLASSMIRGRTCGVCICGLPSHTVPHLQHNHTQRHIEISQPSNPIPIMEKMFQLVWNAPNSCRYFKTLLSCFHTISAGLKQLLCRTRKCACSIAQGFKKSAWCIAKPLACS